MPKKYNDIIELEFLYCKEGGNLAVYNSQGIGVPEIRRVLNGESKVFRSPQTGAIQKQPKTLIVSDPTQMAWGFYTRGGEVVQRLKFLQESGFEIYVLNNAGTGVELWDSSNDDLVGNNPGPLVWMSHEELIQSNPRLRKMPRSKIGFLGTNEINQIMGEKKGERVEIDSSIGYELEKQGYVPTMIKEALEKSNPEGIKWVMKELSQSAWLSHQIITKIDKNSPNSICWEKIILDNQPLEGGPTKDYHFAPQGVDLEIHGPFTLVKDSFLKFIIKRTKINSLKFKEMDFDKINFSEMMTQFENIKGLKRLEFEDCIGLGKILPHLKNHYPELEALLIKGADDLKSEELKGVLRETKSLNELSVISHQGNALDDIVDDETLIMKNIRKVDYSKSMIDGILMGRMRTVLGAHGDIKIISPLLWLFGHGLIERKAYEDLEIADLFGMGLGWTDIENLLIGSRKLRDLRIHVVEIGQVRPLPEDCSLDHLETLSILAESESIDEPLRTIIPHTQKIKKLLIEGGEVSRASAINCLPYLQDLQDLSVYTLSELAFTVTLLKELPCIEKVTIRCGQRNCSDDELDLDFKSSSLKEMELFTNQIRSLEVVGLINACENLIKLSIIEFGDATAEYNDFKKLMNPHALKMIREFSYRVIDNQGLYVYQNFLEKMNDLVGLVLDYKKSDYSEIQISRTSFPSLERFTLKGNQYNYVVASQLASLLEQSAQLKVFRVNCLVKGDFKLPDNLVLNALEILDISNCDFLDEKSLYQLLMKTPNLRELRIVNRQDLNELRLPPNLKRLVIVDATGVEIADGVKKRIKGLVFNVCPEIDTEDGPLAEKDAEKEGNEVQVDLNTQIDNQSFNVTDYFVDQQGKKPAPNLYRLKMNDSVDFSTEKMILVNIAPIDLRDLSSSQAIAYKTGGLDEIFQKIKDDVNNCYLGKIKLKMSKDWIGLPSMSPNETISDFSIEGLEPSQYEIKYSMRDNQYFVKLNENVTVKNREVQYIVKVPNKTEKISEQISHFVNEYARINVPLSEKDQKKTGWEYLQALIEHRAGACRHKAIAFQKELKIRYPALLCRIVTNDCHAYVEIKEPGHTGWVACQLGGYPGTLVHNEGAFAAEKKEAPADPVIKKINPAFAHDIEDPLNHLESKAFAAKILNAFPGKNLLVDFSDNDTINEFQKLIRKVALSESRPLFYIDSPDDVFCHATPLSRDRTGKITTGNPGLGGALYEFLEKYKTGEPHPVLLVNWSRFSDEEIISFNALIDEKRKADMVEIPSSATVIGLYNKNDPAAYQGEDFYSRFDNQYHPEFELNAENDPRVMKVQGELKPVYLHHSPTWQSTLYGSYKLSAEGWYFKEGELIKALESGNSLILHDPPLYDREFQNLIDRIQIEKKITIAGKEYEIPNGFAIQMSKDSYSLKENFKNNFEIKGDSPKTLILNPTTFNEFFERYTVEEHQLITLPGYLEQNKDRRLSLHLTHALTDSQWGQFIAQANEHRVTLQIYAEADVYLPEPIHSVRMKPGEPTIDKTEEHIGEILAKRTPKTLIIDVTDLDLGDLFGKIYNDPKKDSFSFRFKEGLLVEQLNKGMDLILTGNFSDQFMQGLMGWKNTHSITNGSLRIHKPKTKIEFIPTQMNEEFTEGRFIENRTTLLNHAMNESPIVLIEGPTGVGKSTFVLEHFAHQPGINLFNGLDSVSAWIKAPLAGGNNVLFIDEANISEDQKHDWTQFAGMFMTDTNHPEDPPQIVFNGEVVTLTKNHKIVFAGNPKSYGGERHRPALFDNYPIARVKFIPLPDKYIIDSVLKPILDKLKGDHSEAIKILMKAYHEVLALSGGQPWITPRELEHMVHLYSIYGEPQSCAYTVARQVVPPEYVDRLPPPEKDLILPAKNLLNDFVVTDSHRSAATRLNEFIHIRQFKQSGLKSQGLGGLLLEGDPGTGKSDLVIKTLVANGLSENKDFYRIPVKMGFAEKKARLEEAYKKGAIVVIDEINASPSMEKFFNDALSGKLKVDGVVEPGFLLIGTQNPATMAGRRELSVALQRRLLPCQVPSYPHDEMVEVLQVTKHLSKEVAELIVNDFEAANFNRNPPLPFRTLLKKFEEALTYIVNNSQEYLAKNPNAVDLHEKIKIDCRQLQVPTTHPLVQTSFITAHLQSQVATEETIHKNKKLNDK